MNKLTTKNIIDKATYLEGKTLREVLQLEKSGDSENIMKNKQAIYELTVDKNVNKIGNGNRLEKFPLIELPKYIQNNFEKFKNWID